MKILRFLPQQVKPELFCKRCGTAEEAAEKVRMKEENGTAEIAGAEARARFAALTARLKPCPGYKAFFDEFFSKM